VSAIRFSAWGIAFSEQVPKNIPEGKPKRKEFVEVFD
jgi:hypothetical protein